MTRRALRLQLLTAILLGSAGLTTDVVTPAAVLGGENAVAAIKVGNEALACVGDCGAVGSVEVSNLVTGVNIDLGLADLSTCPAFDRDGDGNVRINELLQGVQSALNGCASDAAVCERTAGEGGLRRTRQHGAAGASWAAVPMPARRTTESAWQCRALMPPSYPRVATPRPCALLATARSLPPSISCTGCRVRAAPTRRHSPRAASAARRRRRSLLERRRRRPASAPRTALPRA